MNVRTGWWVVSLGSAGVAMAILIGAAASACSSSGSTTSGGGATASGDGGNGNTNVVNNDAPASCTDANNALTVAFTPMYSAFDGVHTYQIPSIVLSVKDSVITWGASDPSMVTLAPDPILGGILITTKKAGTVTIVASAGGLCGTSLLTITSATPGDWDTGNQRYNDGVSVHLGRGGATYDASAGVGGPACTNCHGPTATDNRYKTVSHTPEQAGGFSDQDLIDIFENGIVPDGGYFDPSIVSYQQWQQFHKWSDITPDQQPGMVAYLRSLTPATQTGSSNFGGLRDGGGPRGDGGGFPPPPVDAGTD
jgi:hypothetical protein